MQLLYWLGQAIIILPGHYHIDQTFVLIKPLLKIVELHSKPFSLVEICGVEAGRSLELKTN